jgi:hypothetical protein
VLKNNESMILILDYMDRDLYHQIVAWRREFGLPIHKIPSDLEEPWAPRRDWEPEQRRLALVKV